MRARETGELRGDPRGEPECHGPAIQVFSSGPVLRLGWEVVEERGWGGGDGDGGGGGGVCGVGGQNRLFIKAPFRAPLPGTE